MEPLLHSEHIVHIEKLVVGGNGLARLSFENKSLVVFIPRTAPDEKAKIKITQVEKNHLIGELLDIIEPSPHRRTAPCEYFSQCGGCSWQHVNENEQIRQKELILTDLLKKAVPAMDFQFLPTVVSEKNLHYRNRIQLKQLDSKLGYFKKASHEIVDIEHCPIAEEAISQQIKKVKSSLRPTAELKKYELRINHLGEFDHYVIGNDGEGLSFSQVNNFVNEKLISRVCELVKEKNPSFVTELYAGAGNFTFPLLKENPDLRMETAEMNPKLTAFSAKKLTLLKLQKRLFAFTSDCESFSERRPLSSEFVLLDPPRAGCSEQVLEKILLSGSDQILYISCHPAFLARDLKKITAAGLGYKISSVQIFDMFPQTDHFETIVLLKRT